MRIMPLLQAACLSLMLSACVAPLLLMSPTSQLMWALLKPLVGFDPNEVNLFEQPLIKDRMTAMLGPNYDSTMQLLKTADELQQEGPLFYLVSRYAPVPEIARQAGMVWNADTNQLAVMLQKGDGATQVFGENLTAAAPAWPGAMQEWQSVSPAATALGGVNQAITNSNEASLGSLMGAVQQSATQAIVNTAQQAVDGATGAAVQPLGKGETAATQATQGVTGDLQQANQAVTDAARQTVSGTGVSAPQQASRAVAEAVTEPVEQAAASAAASPQRQAGKAVVDTARQAVSGATTTAQQASKAEEKGSTLSDQARADAEAELEKLLN